MEKLSPNCLLHIIGGDFMWLELIISSALELGHPLDLEGWHPTNQEMAEYFQTLDPERNDGQYRIETPWEVERFIEPKQCND